ncbi:NAD-dependent epimerase/dehydratase family protein [Campylobacter porcelli]|uniref:UDP-glucuronate decarboxylase n=1 Tax=Campylobacter porcelli TaxID=1660073 RepID=A0A1X9SY08_9BACT|nr:NAD(P)-dependent oxidoreductase [Campylobacter sp. RM6137]ARR01148.1 UDP-glucuronate decarboxylase [Campylobacter sp. RM6137]
MYINNKLYQEDIKKIIIEDFIFLKNKSILITGASGLIGSCIVDILMFLNKKFDFNINIFAIFSNIENFEKRFPSYKNNKHFNILVQDIANLFDYNFYVDYIIHAASNTHPHLYGTKPVETIKLNIIGTLNVFNFAKKNKNSKSIFLSTMEVYGSNYNIKAFKENDIGFVNFMKSRACYPESKRTCETLCHSYIEEYDLDIVIARLGYIYGPTVKMDSTKADVQFLAKALNNENIIIKSEGLQKRSYLYVLDAAAGLLTILLKGKKGETYNVAAKSGNVLLRDYAKQLAQIANVRIVFENATEQEQKGFSTVLNSTLNDEKIKSLGWNEKFTFNEAIEHTFKIKKELINA